MVKTRWALPEFGDYFTCPLLWWFFLFRCPISFSVCLYWSFLRKWGVSFTLLVLRLAIGGIVIETENSSRSFDAHSTGFVCFAKLRAAWWGCGLCWLKSVHEKSSSREFEDSVWRLSRLLCWCRASSTSERAQIINQLWLGRVAYNHAFWWNLFVHSFMSQIEANWKHVLGTARTCAFFWLRDTKIKIFWQHLNDKLALYWLIMWRLKVTLSPARSPKLLEVITVGEMFLHSKTYQCEQWFTMSNL